MHLENMHRLSEYLKSQGLKAALLANPFNITWLSGYAPSIQTGPSPFEGGPALGWFHQDQLELVLNDWEAGTAEALGASVHPYVGYTVDEPLDGTRRMMDALATMLKPYAEMKGVLGVELNYLPAVFMPVLQEIFRGCEFRNLGRDLENLRAVKTQAEIQKIKAALRLSDIAQEEIQKHITPGVTEMSLWLAVKARVELEAGGRTPVLADLVAGQRTAEIGGLPSDYALQPSDPVLLDFVARLDGYWGDNCSGYFVGEPQQELKKVYQVVLDSLRLGRDAIRPGILAHELDALVRDYIRSKGYEPHPHHTGHGLGASYHDEPRIVPYNAMPLEPGMVIVLEPGIYLPDIGGVRLEDGYLVTRDGCEVLTTHLSSA